MLQNKFKLLIVLFTISFSFGQGTITEFGVRVIGGDSVISPTSTVEIYILTTGFTTTPVIDNINSLRIASYTAVDLGGTRHLSNQSGFTSITSAEGGGDPDTLIFQFDVDITGYESDLSYQLIIELENIDDLEDDRAATELTISSYDAVGVTNASYYTEGTIIANPVINTMGIRSERESDTGTYGQNIQPGDSIHIAFTLSAGTAPSTAYRVRLHELNGSGEEVAVKAVLNRSITSIGSDYRVNIRAPLSFDEDMVTMVASIRLNNGESIYYSDEVDAGDRLSGYVDVSSASNFDENTGSTDWWTLLNDGSIVISSLGLYDDDDDNQYLSSDASTIRVRFDVSNGTVPTSAYHVRFYQLDGSNNELTNSLASSVSISTVNDGDEEYEMTFSQPFSSFNASIDHFVVTVQLESSSEVYASSTISGGSQTVISDTTFAGSSDWFPHLIDATPTLAKLGIQANDLSQDLNLNEAINLSFTIGANEEVIAGTTTADVTIYEFNANSSVANITRLNQTIGFSAGEYTITGITGLSTFNSNTDNIAVLVDLSNTTTNFESKDEIGANTYVSDNTVTGNFFSTLNRTNNGPQAPSSFTFRYGAPNDDTIYLSWTNDATAGDASLKEYRIVYDGNSVVAESDTIGADAGGAIDTTLVAVTNYAFVQSGSSLGIRLFVIDENNEYASIALNSNAVVNTDNGLSYTLGQTALFNAPNFNSGTGQDFEILGFTLDPTASTGQETADQIILNQLTINVEDVNGNVSNSELFNLKLIRDVNSNDVYDAGDEELNSVGVTWSEPTITFILDQDQVISSSSAEEFIVVVDAANVDNSMHINVSISDASNITLASDNGIAGTSTGTISGSVAAQGTEVDGDISLPVSLIENSFRAEKVKKGFIVSAETAQEDGVRYIMYQRSTVNKEIDALVESDWVSLDYKIESSEAYLTQGRKLPEFLDKINVKGLEKLRYRIVTEEINGVIKTKYAGNKNIITVSDDLLKVTKFALGQNYPNPFNPKTNIKFSIPYQSKISLVVFNSLGQKVRTLLENEIVNAGKDISVEWNGKNDKGVRIPSGVYFYRLMTDDGSFVKSKKMVLLK